MAFVVNIVLILVSAVLFSGLFEIHAQGGDDCSTYTNCTDCIKNTNCSWFTCQNTTEQEFNLEEEVQFCAQLIQQDTICALNETATQLNCSAAADNSTTTSPTTDSTVTTTTVHSTVTTGTFASTTQAPPVTVVKYKTGFDAGSFIGGIILCGGVIALGLIGYKCYQSRQGKDYSNL